MVNLKDIPEVLDILERWVPDTSRRSAILTELVNTNAARKNKSFRDTMQALLELHAWRHLRKQER